MKISCTSDSCGLEGGVANTIVYLEAIKAAYCLVLVFTKTCQDSTNAKEQIRGSSTKFI